MCVCVYSDDRIDDDDDDDVIIADCLLISPCVMSFSFCSSKEDSSLR